MHETSNFDFEYIFQVYKYYLALETLRNGHIAKEFLPSMKNRNRTRSSFQYNESEEEVNLALYQTSVLVDPQNAVATFLYIEKEYVIDFPNPNICNH